MRAEDSHKEFRALLKRAGLTQKTVELEQAIDLSVAFFRDVRVENATPDGDGLAFYYAHTHRGTSTPFEVGMIRCFRRADQEAPSNGSRLRLSFCYPWWETVISSGLAEQLKPAAPEGNKFCWNPGQVEEFLTYIKQHKTFNAVRSIVPKKVTLTYEPIWGIFG